MKKTILFLSLSIISITISAQLRYYKRCFEQIDTLTKIEYASATWLDNPIELFESYDYSIHEGETQTSEKELYMDIFMPQKDTVSKRPAIIFAFSGGFITGSRHNEDMIAFCDSFAHRGYVTASIDYRTGMGATINRIAGIPIKISITEANGNRAGYRALQDSRAAIRYLKHNSEEYGIDTTKIYLVGSSAGGFMALHNIYIDKTDEIPEYVLDEPSLGNLDTIGVQGYGGRANAIVSLWGALYKPSLIENDNTPAFLVHGKSDSIVYFKKGIPLKSLIPDIQILDFTMPETYGGYCIDTALTNRDIAHETYFVDGQKHEFYGVSSGDFGDDGPNEYWDTINNKISDFFFEIFKPHADFSAYKVDDQTVDFEDLTPGATYAEWNFGDGNTTTGLTVSHTYTKDGNYIVSLKTFNRNMACDTLAKTISINSTGYALLNNNETIKISPNPAHDKLTIEGLTDKNTIEIYNMHGQHLQTVQLSGNNTLNVSSLPKGFYVLRIVSGNENVIKKFQKK